MNAAYQYCGGKMCLSFREARERINGTKRRQHFEHSKVIPKRAYKCPTCGMYHLTSDPTPSGEKRRPYSKGTR